MDPRNPLSAGKLVDEEAGLEVVGAVNDHVDAAEEPGDARRDEVGDDRLDPAGGVDPLEVTGRCHRLGEPGCDVGLVEEHLPGKIGKLGNVAVDDPDPSDPGTNQRHGHDPAERPAADERHMRRGQPLLSGRADRRETDLTGIAIGFERHRVISGRGASRRPFR